MLCAELRAPHRWPSPTLFKPGCFGTTPGANLAHLFSGNLHSFQVEMPTSRDEESDVSLYHFDARNQVRCTHINWRLLYQTFEKQMFGGDQSGLVLDGTIREHLHPLTHP